MQKSILQAKPESLRHSAYANMLNRIWCITRQSCCKSSFLVKSSEFSLCESKNPRANRAMVSIVTYTWRKFGRTYFFPSFKWNWQQYILIATLFVFSTGKLNDALTLCRILNKLATKLRLSSIFITQLDGWKLAGTVSYCQGDLWLCF